jgi:transmembrane sensor
MPTGGNKVATKPDDTDLHAAAIAWWVKRDGGPLTRADEEAFEAWLFADPSHRAAYDEVIALCGQVRALAPGPGPLRVRKARASKSRRLILAGLAAGSVAFLLSFDELTLLVRADYRTGTGETRRVDLADGSHVELAPASAISVDYSGGERKLALLEGEAFFEAAPDPTRPFVVQVKGGSIMALGTAFDIALGDSRVTVTVTQHRVALVSRGETRVLGAGQQSTFGPGLPIAPPTRIDAREATAWRRGKLVFVDQPLVEVIGTLARYHRGYLAVLGKARELRVTGVFEANDPAGIIRAMETALGIRATRLTDSFVILHE